MLVSCWKQPELFHYVQNRNFIQNVPKKKLEVAKNIYIYSKRLLGFEPSYFINPTYLMRDNYSSNSKLEEFGPNFLLLNAFMKQ